MAKFLARSAITRIQAIVIIVVIAIAAIVAVAYYQSISTQPAQAKTVLVIDMFNSPYIDPAVGSDYASGAAYAQLFDTLVFPNKIGSTEPVKPNLALSWNVSQDSLTYTFHLRQGVKFHDGSELKAEDVKFSMDRLLTIGEGYSYVYSPYVESTTVVDSYTAQIKLKRAFGPFVGSLTSFYILNADLVKSHIVTPGAYNESGDYAKDWLLSNDAGSGPYRLKEFKHGDSVLLERFSDYWGEIKAGAPDEVKLVWISDPATIRTMMSRREMDIGYGGLPQETIDALAADPNIGISSVISPLEMFYFMMHNKKAPTDDIHIRKAMSYALDYNTIVNSALPGSRVAKGPIPSGMPGCDPNVYQYTRNLTKAMEEIQQSPYYGQLDQYPVVLHWCAEAAFEEQMCAIFASSMREIGITVNVVKTPWLSQVAEMSKEDTAPNIELILVTATYTEAGAMLQLRFSSASQGTFDQNEWMSNSTIDSMIEDALRTVDTTERYQKYYNLQTILQDMCPSISLCEWAKKNPYQAYYVDWPAARGDLYPQTDYNFAARFIEIDAEKKARLLQ